MWHIILLLFDLVIEPHKIVMKNSQLVERHISGGVSDTV